jgi:hypothetical protein
LAEHCSNALARRMAQAGMTDAAEKRSRRSTN